MEPKGREILVEERGIIQAFPWHELILRFVGASPPVGETKAASILTPSASGVDGIGAKWRAVPKSPGISAFARMPILGANISVVARKIPVGLPVLPWLQMRAVLRTGPGRCRGAARRGQSAGPDATASPGLLMVSVMCSASPQAERRARCRHQQNRPPRSFSEAGAQVGPGPIFGVG